jgi:hypothetical protein
VALAEDSKSNELARATAADLAANGYEVLAKGMDPRRIGHGLSSTRNAVHSRLRTLGKGQRNDELIANLAEVYLDRERTGETQRLADTMLQAIIEAESDAPIDVVADLCRAYFDIVDEQAVTDVQMVLWLGRSEPAIRDRLRELYSSIDDVVSGLFDSLLDHWGREMLAPFTTRELAVAMSALVEGLIVRKRIDPPVVSNELFGRILIALVPTVTRPEGHEPVALNDIVAPYATPRPPHLPPSLTDLRSKVCRALEVRLRAGSARVSTSLDDIALDIGIDSAVLGATLGGLDEAVAADILDQALLLGARGTDVVQYLETLRTAVAQSPDLFRWFLSSCAEPAPPAGVRNALAGLARPLGGPADPTRAGEACTHALVALLAGRSAGHAAGLVAAALDLDVD